MKGRNNRKRTKFSNDDLEILNLFFEKNPMPSRSDISILSEKLAYPRYIVQVCRSIFLQLIFKSIIFRYGFIINVNHLNELIHHHHHLNWIELQNEKKFFFFFLKFQKFVLSFSFFSSLLLFIDL